MSASTFSSSNSRGRQSRQGRATLGACIALLLSAALASCGSVQGGVQGGPIDGLDSSGPVSPAQTSEQTEAAAAGGSSASAGPVLPHSGSHVEIPDEFMPGGDSFEGDQNGQIDPGVIWASIHQPLSPGHNELDCRRYTGKNALSHKDDLFIGFGDDGMGGQEMLYKPGMWLLSDPGELGFITYGLRSLPEGHRIESLSIDCGGLYILDENPDDFWVGVSDRQADAWHWYGPFELGSLQDLDISDMVLMNEDEQYGYITIATHDTDALGIVGLSLEVQPVI